jgi:Calcium-binding EGF domain
MIFFCSLLCCILLSDIDECQLGNDVCSENTLCANNPGSFTCPCQSGYERVPMGGRRKRVDCTGKQILLDKKLVD